jgi:hypothetical protein
VFYVLCLDTYVSIPLGPDLPFNFYHCLFLPSPLCRGLGFFFFFSIKRCIVFGFRRCVKLFSYTINTGYDEMILTARLYSYS